MGNPYDLPVPHRNPQQHPDVYELNDMVGVMAFQDDALAEQMLPIPPGKGRKEIIGGITDQGGHLPVSGR